MMIIPNLFGNPYTMSVEFYWGECYNYGLEGYLMSMFLGIGASLLVLLSFWSSPFRLCMQPFNSDSRCRDIAPELTSESDDTRLPQV